MLVLKMGKNYAVPVEKFHKIQQKNLKSIKYDGREITDFKRLSAYYPEVQFKNVSRTNEDASIDIVIDVGVANELSTGFLPKRYYKALQVKKEKSLLGGVKWNYVKMFQVSEEEILARFHESMPIKEIEAILEAMAKKKVNYFG